MVRGLPLLSCENRKLIFFPSDTVGWAKACGSSCPQLDPACRWRSFLRSCVAVLTVSFVALLAFPGPQHAQEPDNNLVATETLTVGIPEGFPPYYLVDKAGKVSGFAVDFMEEIAQRSNVNVRYEVFQSWSAVISALETGEIDLIPNIGIWLPRRIAGPFTIPFETMEIALFVRSDAKALEDFHELKNRRVGAVEA